MEQREGEEGGVERLDDEGGAERLEVKVSGLNGLEEGDAAEVLVDEEENGVKEKEEIEPYGLHFEECKEERLEKEESTAERMKKEESGIEWRKRRKFVEMKEWTKGRQNVKKGERSRRERGKGREDGRKKMKVVMLDERNYKEGKNERTEVGGSSAVLERADQKDGNRRAANKKHLDDAFCITDRRYKHSRADFWPSTRSKGYTYLSFHSSDT